MKNFTSNRHPGIPSFTAFVIVFGLAILLGLLCGCKKDPPPPPDPCAGIICMNDGSCANGICNCPPQWTGSGCTIQNTPSKIKVTQITVTGFPPTFPNGDSWDTFSGADLYVELSYNNSVVYSTRETLVFENAAYNTDHVFNFGGNVFMDSPAELYVLRAYDRDDNFTADDYLGGVQFAPYFNTNGFPSELNLNCAQCGASFKMEIEYQF